MDQHGGNHGGMNAYQSQALSLGKGTFKLGMKTKGYGKDLDRVTVVNVSATDVDDVTDFSDALRAVTNLPGTFHGKTASGLPWPNQETWSRGRSPGLTRFHRPRIATAVQADPTMEVPGSYPCPGSKPVLSERRQCAAPFASVDWITK